MTPALLPHISQDSISQNGCIIYLLSEAHFVHIHTWLGTLYCSALHVLQFSVLQKLFTKEQKVPAGLGKSNCALGVVLHTKKISSSVFFENIVRYFRFLLIFPPIFQYMNGCVACRLNYMQHKDHSRYFDHELPYPFSSLDDSEEPQLHPIAESIDSANLVVDSLVLVVLVVLVVDFFFAIFFSIFNKPLLGCYTYDVN